MTSNRKYSRHNFLQMSKGRTIPATVIKIVTLMGVSATSERNSLITNLLHDGLENLPDKNKSRIKETCIAYSNLPHPKKYYMSRSVLKRLISLVLWIKDKSRTGGAIESPTGIAKV